MASTVGPLAARFEQVLEDFKKTLKQDEVDDFSFATLNDLKQLVCDIQRDQAASRRMKNLNRLAYFLEAMEQYDKTIQIFLNASNFVAFIWGPIKFLLQIASTYAESFNALLDAYQDIGENIPLLLQYEQIFKNKAALRPILGLIYTDIMEFHRSAIKYFRGPVWKQLFQAAWKTYRTRFNAILVNLQRHKHLVENQASLIHFEQYQEDRIKTEANFRKIQEEGDRHQRITLANWLSGPDIAEDQRRASSARTKSPQSGLWLLQDVQVKKWMDSSYPLSPCLWVNGKPGAGKTVLASLLIEECQNLPSVNVYFFYNKYGDPKRNNLIAVLRSILAQMLCTDSALTPYMFEVASNSGSNNLDNEELAREIFDVAISAFNDPVYLILDGLDECPKAKKAPITSFFRSVVVAANDRKPGALRCCFFSQDDNDMGELLKGIPILTITSRHNKDDILNYCKAEGKLTQDKFELGDDETRAMAEDVSTAADGMFIFATLVMSNLLNQVSRKRLRKEMKEIPTSLNQVYERIVHRILYESEPAESVAAKRLLGWLVCAIRPLRWHEVQGAASYDVEDHTFDFEEGKFRKDPKRLCGSLVDMHADAEIRFVHLTAELYLKRHILHIYQEELDLFCLCLNYLRLPAFDNGHDDDTFENFALKGHYAFMDYALASWPIHLQRLLQKPQFIEEKMFKKLSQTIRSFFSQHPVGSNPLPIRDKSTTDMLQPFREENFFDQLVQSMTTAETMAYSPSKESKGSEESELHLIPRISHIRVVIEKIMKRNRLDHKAKLGALYGLKLFKCPRVRCQHFHDGFYDQAERDRHLNQHERPYICAYQGCPAAFLGYTTAQQLKKHKTDYHPENADPSTFPWHQKPSSIDIEKELRNGNREAFDLWLDQFENWIPRDKLWQGGKCRGPLRAAIDLADLDMLRAVLDRADPSLLQDSKKTMRKPNQPSATRIIRAALNKHNIPAVEEIISRADHLRDPDLLNLFDTALREGLDQTAIKFLDHPSCEAARPSPRPTRLASYLSISVRYCRLAVVGFLMYEKGADPNKKDSSGSGFTALGAAAYHNQIEAARFLLDSGKCDKSGLSGGVDKKSMQNTAAQIAHRWGNIEFLTYLFPDQPTQPEDEVWFWITRLLEAARDGEVEKVKRIIDQGNVNLDVSNRGPTPLLLAVQGNHISTVECLLQTKKVNVDIRILRRNAREISPLSIAIEQEYVDIVRMLLAHGGINFAEPSNFQGGWEYYPYWRLARKGGNKSMIKLIEDEEDSSQPQSVINQTPSIKPMFTDQHTDWMATDSDTFDFGTDLDNPRF